MKKFFLACILLFPLITVSGQGKADKPLRIEIPAKADDESHRILAMGDKGVVLFFKSIEKQNDSLVKWYFSFYDKNLKHKWLKSVAIPANMEFFKSLFVGDKGSFCFVKAGKEKGTTAGILVLGLDPESGEFLAKRAGIPEKSDPAGFYVTAGKAFFAYNTKNDVPAIKIIELSTGKISGFEWSNNVPSLLTGFMVDTLSATILGYLKKFYTKNKYEYFISYLDFSGKPKGEVLVNDKNASGSGDTYILDINTVRLSNGDLGAYGAYRTGSIKNQDKNNLVLPATGIYYLRISGGQVVSSRFTNFLTFGHTALPGKSEIESFEKKAGKKNKDINEFSLDYSVIVHPVDYVNNEMLLLADLFTPQFHMENYTNFDYYGRPSTNSYRVFDGYRFINGIVIGMNGSGDILWKNGIELVNLVSFNLEPKVNFSIASDSTMLLSYLSQGKVGYKVIDHDKVIEKLDFSSLEMLSAEDKLLNESKSNMIPWYDNNFLCYGYQEIKNINASENRKRIVFFLTKISSD
ncbi:MAG: hypothetical protein ACM3N9_08510 [Syntrophothermus sp.]